VRRGARWALGVGAALVAMTAVSGVRADVLSIDLNECATRCVLPASNDEADAETESAGDVTLSLLGGGGGDADTPDARADMVLNPKALPPDLVSGLPSPIANIGAQTLESPGVSPYAFFNEVVDIALPIDPRTGLYSPSLHLFAPSLIGRLTLTDVISDGNALFKQPPRPAL
jgi:hypothetical protein